MAMKKRGKMRFELIYDAGDWILDNETGEYMGLEEACQKLNELEESMGVVGDFFSDIAQRLEETEEE